MTEFKNLTHLCIKGLPIDSVQTRTLSEIGFPVEAQKQPDLSRSTTYYHYFQKLYDSPYSVVHSVEKMYVQHLMELRNNDLAFDTTLSELQRYGLTSEELIAGLISGCVYSLSAEEADTYLEEFVFIIETMLPRQLSDIYYSFDIEPNPAHGVFFDLAVKKLGIPQYTDRTKNNYGQFISYTADGVKQRILNGEPFQSIYLSTCATKTIINDAFRSMRHDALLSSGQSIHQRRIEHAIFSLSRQYTYEINKGQLAHPIDYIIRENGKEILAIFYCAEEQMANWNDLAAEVQLNHCRVPLLVLDYAELDRGHISATIRSAVKDQEYASVHREERRRYFKYGKVFDDCYGNWDAAQTASLCGCFSCGRTFAPDEIMDWFDDEDACCPHCDSTTVIMDSQGYEITEEFLQELLRFVDEVDEYEE
ncbi:MAG: hypothetical protein KIG43_00195 [Eubacteriales bacterium]|nr:hypothetical protein [Eubacteriales bacterium]